MANQLKNFVRGAISDRHYSPDFPVLQAKYKLLPTFIYGTEQTGYSDDGLLRYHPRVGIGFLPASTHALFITKENQPFVLPVMTDGHPIRGEMYLLPPAVIADLDMKNVNGIFMHRLSKTVHWYRDEDKDKKDKQWFSTECFTWIGNVSRYKFLLDQNTAARLEPFTSGDGHAYYHFRRSHDKPNMNSGHYIGAL